jgi:hypothetical protein
MQCIPVIVLLIISIGPKTTLANKPSEDDSTIVILSGKVVNSSNNNSLFHVHIINLSLNRATLSDRFGYFHLEARLDDTLYLSHVGFKKRLYRLTPDAFDSGAIATIQLYEDTVMLKKFRLLAATREVQFKTDFVNRQVVPDTLNPAFEAFIKENHFTAPSYGIVLPGPFTVIYENFNKQARLKRRIERNRSEYYDNLPEEEKKKVLFFEE